MDYKLNSNIDRFLELAKTLYISVYLLTDQNTILKIEDLLDYYIIIYNKAKKKICIIILKIHL